MNANELRIGNYVKDPYSKEIRVLSIDINDSMLRPIPLTEEWLLKFGFKKLYNILDGDWKLDDFYLSYDLDEDVYFMFTIERLDVTIKYVHSLQNLYFALTNQELEIIE